MAATEQLPRALRWFLAVACVFFAVGAVVITPTGEQLECHADATGWRCEHRLQRRFQSDVVRSFDQTNTAEISFAEYTAGKHGRRKMGRIEVFDAKGDPLQIFETTRFACKEHHAALSAFVEQAESGGAPGTLTRKESPGGGGLFGALIFLAAAGFLIYELVTKTTVGESGTAVATPSTSASAPSQPKAWKVPVMVIGGVFLVAGIFTVVEFAHQSGKGYVTVVCKHRCRVEGMDCRPSGMVGSWQPPGPYTVEAYDPNAPGGWTPVTIEVKEGERQTLICAPPQ